MKKIVGAAAALSFLFALGIVGAVEQGAALSLMWWTLPALGVLALAPRVLNKENGGAAPANKKGEQAQ